MHIVSIQNANFACKDIRIFLLIIRSVSY